MTTLSARPGQVKRAWCLVDAKGKTLGRLASVIATVLRGKHKVTYTPHVDVGDHVVVINAALVHATGKKERKKLYRRHSGYPGGLRETALRDVRTQHPCRIIEHAVRGMLPRGPLGRAMFRKMQVHAGPEHPHAAQKPTWLDV